MDKAWDRRDGESIPAYEALTAYVLMGPARSIKAVGRELGKSGSLLSRWSEKFDWVERSAAWDRHQSDIAHKARTKVHRSQSEKWARRSDAYRELLWKPYRLAKRHVDHIERELAEKGRPPSIVEVETATRLVNEAKASAREAILGIPGVVVEGAPAKPRLEIPGSDVRHDDDGPEVDPGGRPAPAGD